MDKSETSPKKAKQASQERLHYWSTRMEDAYRQFNRAIFDERERIYHGTHQVDRNINSEQHPALMANNVYNVAYEMIESQTDTQIPMPSVKSKRRGFNFLADMVEESLRSDLHELEVHIIHDQVERLTPLHGVSFVMVEWNPNIKNHNYRGDLQLRLIHPKQLIPQPKVYRLQSMDYFFILTSVTKDYIKRRYGVDVEAESEHFPEMNEISGMEIGKSEGMSPSLNLQDDKVTECICFYRDDDDDIGKFVFTNEVVLEDLPKLFKRRQEVCESCGTTGPQGITECPTCGSKKLKTTVMETETVEEPMVLVPVSYKQMKKIIEVDPATGLPAIQEHEIEEIVPHILTPGTEVPYFTPNRYPIAVRINTPKSFSLSGQSDIDIIRDQQDALKKVISKIEGKILNSGSILKVPRSANFTPTNRDNQIVRGDIAELHAISAVDLQPNIQQDVEFARQMYEYTKSTLGISDSWQGKYDPSAKSGVAKQTQIERAAGRLTSKILNRMDFYRQLYEIMFQYKLAYYDELRPYITRTSMGEDDWGDFNKYEFLMQDAAGEWFYNTDFIFTADAGEGIPNNKLWLFDQIQLQLQGGALDILQYWTLLEQLKFPNATMILEQLRSQQKQAQQMQQAAMQEEAAAAQQMGVAPDSGLGQVLGGLSPEQQGAVQQMIEAMPPEKRQAFMALSPEEQVQLIQEAIQ